MSLLLLALLLTTVSCRPSSQNTSMHKTTSPGDIRSVVESAFVPSVDVDSSDLSPQGDCPRLAFQRGRSQSRRVLQEEMRDDAEDVPPRAAGQTTNSTRDVMLNTAFLSA